MRLEERLKKADERSRRQADVPVAVVPGEDPFIKLKNRAQQALFAKLGPRLYDSSMSDVELQEIVAREL